MAGRRLHPKLFPDFVARITNASPLDALEELIWNAFDELATRVEIRVKRNRLGGVDEILVTDNGTSLSYADAPAKFESLGNSDKQSRQLETGAKLHGRLGQGRHKALSLGAACEWTFTYAKRHGHLSTYRIEGTAGRSDPFYLHAESAAAPGIERGCSVRITQISRSLHFLITPDARRSLVAKFAPFLIAHPDRELLFNGQAINPRGVIRGRRRLRPITISFEGTPFPAAAEVIHWVESKRHREVFLCGESGVPLHRLGDSFLGATCDGTVFVTCSAFDKLHQQNLLQTVESSTDKERVEMVRGLRAHIRGYFARERRKAAQTVIEDLKDEGSYPYRRAPKNDIDRIERQVFDLCALNISRHLPNFQEGMDPDGRKLLLRLIQEALSQSPSSVGKIIREVIKLPAADADRFSKLLDDVPLTNVVNAAHLIAQRLEFLSSFRAITMLDPFQRTIRERTELHRILASNTWLFGEEYHLGTSDQGFRAVLEKHISVLGRDQLAPEVDPTSLREAMNEWNQSRKGSSTSLDRVPDLMIYRRFTERRLDEYEFLVVEIKRPGIAIGDKEYRQLRDYARAVVQTPWADQEKSKWVFVIVSDSLDDDIDELAHQANLPPYTVYVHASGKYELRAMPWSVIIQNAEGRHERLREWLNHSVPIDVALARASSIYREYLPEGKAEIRGRRRKPK